LYELWIDKSCRGWADQVFVIDVDGEVAGYLTCHVHDGAGQIGLVAVAPASRGRGAGSALVARGRRWFADQGVGRVSVVTQARSCGIRLHATGRMTVQSAGGSTNGGDRPADDAAPVSIPPIGLPGRRTTVPHSGGTGQRPPVSDGPFWPLPPRARGVMGVTVRAATISGTYAPVGGVPARRKAGDWLSSSFTR
jgi:hypothetical protein